MRYLLLPVVSSACLCTPPAPADSAQVGVSIMTNIDTNIQPYGLFTMHPPTQVEAPDTVADTSANTVYKPLLLLIQLHAASKHARCVSDRKTFNVELWQHPSSGAQGQCRDFIYLERANLHS